MTAGSAPWANRWAIAASFGGQVVMMLAAASVAVTTSASPAPHSATNHWATITPAPALVAPYGPNVITPPRVTLLPYVQLIDPKARKALQQVSPST